MSLRELAMLLEISSPAVGYFVERGENIARFLFQMERVTSLSF